MWIATRPFNLLGTVYKPGDRVEVSEFQANQLARQALVKLHTPAESHPAQPDGNVQPPKRGKKP